MYPFWEPVIEPLVRRSQARRIVEIGALRGETTAKMLEDLGPDAEIHVIDPLPQFDPAEHEARFPGRYIFHRDLSLNVLPDAAAFDLALIDGDHNWYTVYNECSLLRDAARREDVHLPLMVLHDVGWPYGRRDLYYDPSNIPEDQQQPWDRRGMTPSRPRLLKRGGMNVDLANAIVEGGPRNGVRTGLDDFVAEHDKPIRQVVIPIYYGLAIVAEEAYLDDHPDVREMLDRLESPDGVRELLELSESIRLDEVVFSHNVGRMNDGRLDRAITRHLDLLRASLLDEHYVENEARIDHLIDVATRSGGQIDAEMLRSPRQHRPPVVREYDRLRRQGDPKGVSGAFAATDVGRLQLDAIHEALETVRRDGVTGDLVEVGCGRGGVGIYLRGYLDAHEDESRTVWVADEFRAGPTRERRPLDQGGVADLWADLTTVRHAFERFGLLDERVRFVQGPPGTSLPDSPIGPIALLRIGRPAAGEVDAILAALGDRLADGALVLVDEADDATRAAIAAHRGPADTAVERLGWDGLAWRHATDGPAPAPALGGGPVPLAGDDPDDPLDLSVVVIFHNMAREAQRTLHSLSRRYQLGLDDVRYEVIAIDNGSDPDQRLTDDFVRGFGEEFRLVSITDDAEPSPNAALNQGMQSARGTNLAFMIDGAHLLSPGVLRGGLDGLGAFGPAIVATQQWYVGPGQQPDFVREHYNQDVEDRLFENIEWPADGYRLFEISHFIGERDWLDGIIESNCLFTSRELLRQVGGFDERFSMPGGGYTNLEFYERLGSHPDTKVVTILGEGSFHQVHGGITTNDGSVDDRRSKIFGYGDHFRELRGRTLGGPGKHLHYIGSFASWSAKRTRSRRLSAMAFDGPDTRGEFPTQAVPMPDEVAAGVIDSFWRTLAWKESTWLGHPIRNAPTDLMIYQELLTSIRPDHVVVIEREDSGTARFVASICELLGHGRAISVGAVDPGEAPRLLHVEGTPQTRATVDTVRAAIGDDDTVMVILGAGGRAGLLKLEFEAYAPLVSVGSYLIFEDTIVNGNPVWPGYGAGPLEAMRALLPHHGEFVQDTGIERFGLTFNPGGYLRRLS